MVRELHVAFLAAVLLMGCRREPTPAPAAGPGEGSEGSAAAAAADAPVSRDIVSVGLIELSARGAGMDVVGAGDAVVVWAEDGTVVVANADGTSQNEAVRVPLDLRDAARSADGVWVAEGSGASATLRTASRTTPTALPGPAHDVWVDDAGYAWFVTQGVDGAAVVVIASDGATVMRQEVGGAPVGLVPSADRTLVAVASMRGQELAIFDVVAHKLDGSVPLSFSPVAAAFVSPTTVAAFSVSQERAALVTSRSTAPPVARDHAADGAIYLARGLDAGGLIAASSVTKQLIRYDGELEAQARVSLVATPFAVAASAGRVWLTDDTPQVLLFDEATLEPVATWALPSPASRLEAHGDVVFVLVPDARALQVLRAPR